MFVFRCDACGKELQLQDASRVNVSNDVVINFPKLVSDKYCNACFLKIQDAINRASNEAEQSILRTITH